MATGETVGRETTASDAQADPKIAGSQSPWFSIGCLALFVIVVAVLLIALLGSAPPPSPSFSPPNVLPSR
jgi:hypothetical protein